MKKFYLKTFWLMALLAALFMGCHGSASTDDEPEPPETPASPTTPATPGTGENPDTPQAETEKTGTVEIAANVETVTVTFVDSNTGDDKNETETITLVSGQNSSAKVPEWTREGYELSWVCKDDEEITVGKALSKDVTFTARWRKFYTVTFVDSEAGTGDDAIVAAESVKQKIYADAEDDDKKATLPDFASKTTDYKLSWTSSVEGVTVDSEITEDVTFTAVWTARTIYTVTFKDAEAEWKVDPSLTDKKNEEVVVKIYDDEGDKTIAESDIPAWTKTHQTLSWESSETGLTTSSKITKDVTFTAKWTEDTHFTVTYKDSAATWITNDTAVADVTEEVYKDEAPAKVPTWEKAHGTLSWNPEIPETITAEATYTAVWTELPKYTVTFKDNGIPATVTGGEAIAAGADSVQQIYKGEKAELPSWATDATRTATYYISSWATTVDTLTPTSAITEAVTFTATWAKIPTETVIIFEKSETDAKNKTTVSFVAEGVPEGYAKASGSKDYKSGSEKEYTSAGGTKVKVRYGVKLNSSGSIVLTLPSAYKVIVVAGDSNGITMTDSENKACELTAASSTSYATYTSKETLTAGTYTIKATKSETSAFAIVLQK